MWLKRAPGINLPSHIRIEREIKCKKKKDILTDFLLHSQINIFNNAKLESYIRI